MILSDTAGEIVGLDRLYEFFNTFLGAINSIPIFLINESYLPGIDGISLNVKKLKALGFKENMPIEKGIKVLCR